MHDPVVECGCGPQKENQEEWGREQAIDSVELVAQQGGVNQSSDHDRDEESSPERGKEQSTSPRCSTAVEEHATRLRRQRLDFWEILD